MGWEASPLETDSVRRGLERFMEMNPHIKVEYTPVPGDEYHTRLLTLMAGNAAPDVFFINPEGYYRQFVERGVLLQIDEYFYKSLSLEDFIEMDQRKMLVDGHIYGSSSCVVAPVLYYNKALFDEAGIPYPSADPTEALTWDEFIAIAKKLTKSKGRITQFGAYGFENMHPREATIYSNNGLIFSEDYAKTVLNDEAQQALQKILELRTVHKVSPPAAFLEQTGMNAAQMLQTGRVAMVADGSWALQELAKMNFDVGVAPPTHHEAASHNRYSPPALNLGRYQASRRGLEAGGIPLIGGVSNRISAGRSLDAKPHIPLHTRRNHQNGSILTYTQKDLKN